MDSLISEIRTFPAREGEDYARSLVELWAWRPDLREQFSHEDQAFVRMMAGRKSEPAKYARESPDRSLADFYADLFNSYLDADVPVTAKMRADADDELEGGEFGIDFAEGKWTVTGEEEPEKFSHPQLPLILRELTR